MAEGAGDVHVNQESIDDPDDPEDDLQHPVHNYFTSIVKDKNNPKNSRSKCVLAGCKNEHLKTHHLGNLKRHLKRQHPDAYKDMQKEESIYRKHQEEEKSQRVASRKRPSSTVMTLPQIKRNLARLVSVRGRPLKLNDDPEFQAFAQQAVNQLPHQQRFKVNSENVRGFCEEYATAVRNLIKEETKGKLISVKVDSCSKGGRSFFAINIQIIRNAYIHIRTLIVKEMLMQQTAENLKSTILSVLRDDFDISRDQVYTLTADNGANMLLAGHLIEEEQEDDAADLDLDLFVLQDDDDDDEWSADGVCLAAADFRCQCIRCAAHSLQLAVEQGLKACPRAVQVIDTVRAVVTKLRSAQGRRQLDKAKATVPSLDNATRWNTKSIMLESTQKLQEFIEKEYIEDPKDKLPDLDWAEVDSIVKTFAPAKTATTKLQAEQLLPGDFLHIWNKCKTDIAKIDTELGRSILTQMNKVAEASNYKSGPLKGKEKWPSLLDHPTMLAAIYMDPRYMMYLDDIQRGQAQDHLKSLWLRLQHMKRRHNDESSEEVMETAASNPQNLSDSDSDDDFIKSLREKNIGRVTSARTTSNITILLEKYFHETPMIGKKTNVLQYWDSRKKTDPELFELSCVVLAVPVTQVSVERLFSSLRFILNYLRKGLTGCFLDDLLVTRNNILLMEKATKKITAAADAVISLASSSSSSSL